jgi:4-hydroxy-4-methyl-2-oxoglutarate aldolase
MNATTPDIPACAPVADACIREGIRFTVAPPGLVPLFETGPIFGPALAVKHAGSVDVFLEAFNDARPGSILVIDNEARHEEGCIGDLTAVEAQHARVQGAVIWGRHRDSSELRRLRFPVTSLGPCPVGPNRKKPGRGSIGEARIGSQRVTTGDLVFMDADGVIFVAKQDATQVVAAAREIMERERTQAELVKRGTTLREQFRFSDYLAQRKKDPSYTFREHLKRLRAAIEV